MGFKRITMLGTVGAGKSSLQNCVFLQSMDMATDPNQGLTVNLIESEKGERISIAKFQDLHFPDSTPPGIVFSATLVLTRTRKVLGRGLMSQTAYCPSIELAGETIADTIIGLGKEEYGLSNIRQKSDLVNKYVLGADAYIVVVAVPRLKFVKGQSYENEPGNLSQYTDVNVSRMLTTIINHKKKYGQPIPDVLFVFTKYDQMYQLLEGERYNLQRPEERERFMKDWFIQTWNCLHAFGMDKITFVPMYINLQYAEDGVTPKQWADKTPMIAKDPIKPNRPDYGKEESRTIVNWILSHT